MRQRTGGNGLMQYVVLRNFNSIFETCALKIRIGQKYYLPKISVK